jgi:hypothetical protein
LNALLFRSERIADPRLPALLGVILRQPTPNRSLADVHTLADVLNTQALFLDPAHDFQFEAGV